MIHQRYSLHNKAFDSPFSSLEVAHFNTKSPTSSSSVVTDETIPGNLLYAHTIKRRRCFPPKMQKIHSHYECVNHDVITGGFLYNISPILAYC